MTTIAHIHEISVAIENTLALIKQSDTDEKRIRAALLELYIEASNRGMAEQEQCVKTIRNNAAKALRISKEAMQAIQELEASQ